MHSNGHSKFNRFATIKWKPNDLRMGDIELTERKGKLIVRKGKWNRYREVPLNVDCRRILMRYIEEHKPIEFLFDSQRSDALSTRGVQHIFEKYNQLTGINDLTAHTLRHTFCHELVSKKISLDVVARLAGHKFIHIALYFLHSLLFFAS